jgi:magnesium-transporting ATPase (P-type)
MSAQNLTVAHHSYALNMADLIRVKNAKKINKETAAKFGGNHPPNYKFCENYHNLIKGNNKFRNNTQRTPPVNINIYRNNIQHSVNSQQHKSNADVTKSNTNQVEDTAIILTKFLDEFKELFNQLLHQNSMILNMLTMSVSQ